MYDTAPMQILLVEDNERAREPLAEILREEGYEVRTAAGGHEALELAEERPPDLIVSDVRMPAGGGLELVSEVRRRAWGQGTAVLLISALAASADRVAGLDVGADDYLTKPVDLDELLARVRSLCRRVRREAELRRDSHVDPLTGLLNRRGLMASYAQEQARDRRVQRGVSLVMVDLNDFKAINDRYGHQAGDQALKDVARALRATLRASDFAGRVGGDEFAVVMGDADHDEARGLAARLRAMGPVTASLPGGTELRIGLAVGAATARQDETLDAVLARADRAMYGHKASLRHPERPGGRRHSA